MNQELKPCPFCGSEDVKLENEYCACRNCGARAVKFAWQKRIWEYLKDTRRLSELVCIADFVGRNHPQIYRNPEFLYLSIQRVEKFKAMSDMELKSRIEMIIGSIEFDLSSFGSSEKYKLWGDDLE